MARKKKFKNRYVLGKGYPAWHDQFALGLWNKKVDGDYIDLAWIPEIEEDDCPKYRLVLERVREIR